MSVSVHGQTTTERVLPPIPVSTAPLPWARLIGGLAAIESVAQLGLVTADDVLDLWVIFRDEDDLAEAEVSRLEREYRVAVGPSPFELHLVALSMIDAANLPPFETILAR